MKMSFPINDDCMLLISDYLNLKDLFSLAFVSKDFQNLIKIIFERRPTLIGDYWRKPENQFHIPKLLQYLWNIDGEAECYDIALLKNKAALEKIQFEEVKNLRVKSAIELNRNVTEADEIEEIIVNSFPNLKVLQLDRRFSGKYFANFNQSIEIIFYDRGPSSNVLDTLTLKKFQFAQSVGFSVVCQHPKCRLNSQDIIWEKKREFVSDQPWMAMNYPNANMHYQTIPIGLLRLHGYRDNIFSIKVWLKPITRLLFNHHFGTMDNFTKIKPKDFKELKELYFLNAENRQHQKKLLNLIYECQELYILDISGSVFGVDFVKSLIKFFDMQKKRRKLYFCCYNTKITKKDLQQLVLPKNLTLTLTENDVPSRYWCQCVRQQ